MTEQDRRGFTRAKTRAKGVVLLDDKHIEGDLRDVSATGAQMVLGERPSIGSDLILFADEFGRLEGEVVRHTPAGIGLTFKGGEKTKKSVLAKLARYTNRLWAPTRDDEDAPRRLFLETLAISGRVAALRDDRSPSFWTMVEDCQARGWVSTHPISPGIHAVEITRLGRRVLTGPR